MAEHGGENFVRITRIDGQRRNLLSVTQAEVRPGLASVSGFVNAVAHRQVRPVQSFAAAYINNVGIDGATAIAPTDCEDS